MLKMVPDPPQSFHSLEDTLIQATDYVQIQMPNEPRTLS